MNTLDINTATDMTDKEDARTPVAEEPALEKPVDHAAADAAPVVPGASPPMDTTKPDIASPTELTATKPTPESAGKPRINVAPGALGESIREITAVLRRTGQFFARQRRLATIQRDKTTAQWIIRDVNLADLVLRFALTTEWMRFKPATSSWVCTDPDERLCRLFLNMDASPLFKPIRGLAHQPHIRPDGSVCSEPGYDAATGLFGAFDPMPEKPIGDPDKESARAALQELDSLLDEFAFAGPSDRAAALSAMLTAAVRSSLPHAPLFHIAAHQPGSGKSYLSRLITAFATPTANAPVAFPRTQDECDKLLLAQLMRSPAVIEFDNLTTDLKPFDKLCSALTSEQIEGRVLGTSGTIMASTRVLMLSSGNNVRPIGDMLRRTVVINLDPGVESPATRSFKRPDLIDEVQRERASYVSAALTVVKAWLDHEGKSDVMCKPLNSFHAWTDWCRKPLIWLDYEDPASGLFKGLDEDPAKLLLARIVNGWKARVGSRPMMTRELIAETTRAISDDGFYEALTEASGGGESINSRKLGHWLAQHQGRIVDGMRISRAPKSRNAESWRVESVLSV